MDRLGLICRTVLEEPGITQREMAQRLDVSLGTVNSLIKECISEGFIAEGDRGEEKWKLLEAGRRHLEPFKVDGALIIAAGFGSRFVPLTFETPKGLLEVFGERMIERQIKQLHQAGIRDITIAVGYLKEKFEYLIDRYDVKLIYNPEYSRKNTLATLYRCRSVLEGRNMYILASDNWLRDNMYHAYECGAWYSSSFQKGETGEWCLAFNKKGRITDVKVGGRDSWVMYGPAYFSREFSKAYLAVLKAYYELPGTEQLYWEQVFADMISGQAARRIAKEDGGLLSRAAGESGMEPEKWAEIEMDINRQPEGQVYEFENLEELRLFDPKYRNQSDNEALGLVARVFGVSESQIGKISCLKSGMTNKSFLFELKGKRYICRVPGPGSGFLVNRVQEKAVYDAVIPLGITEPVVYLEPENGYKISEFVEGARNAQSDNWTDMERMMGQLGCLHASGASVEHSFDIRERISFYESLCRSHGGTLFEDYGEVRKQVNWMLDALDAIPRKRCLCHVDANVDNCLVLENGEIRLLDWEYAGMCDPLIDVAMCAIYSCYGEEETDRLLKLYLKREPSREERFITYAYAALGGFLWSLWAVYKSVLGEEFGEYTIIMYRYAKKYYRKVRKL